jgi:hypothetical protein
MRSAKRRAMLCTRDPSSNGVRRLSSTSTMNRPSVPSPVSSGGRKMSIGIGRPSSNT